MSAPLKGNARRTGVPFLDMVERVGNRLPDPVTLFAAGALLTLVGSELAAALQWTVDNPATGKTETATSLLSNEGLRWVWLNLVENFTGFAPLGVVLVAMIGIGVAERTGLLGALLQSMVLVTPRSLITPALVFVGVMSSMAMDAGYVVLPPLAAAIFARAKRAPVVGMAAAFAGVAAGFSANLLITAIDPLLQSFTQEAAHILDGEYAVDVRCNYYFMIASTLLMTATGWAVTHFVVEPRYDRDQISNQIAQGAAAQTQEVAQAVERTPGAASDHSSLTPAQKRGLIWALVALVVSSSAVLFSILTPGSALNGSIEPRPGWQLSVWVAVIVPILFALFLAPGLAYGVGARTITSDRDVAKMMADTMSAMGPYIVLAFFAAQFVAFFGHSNLGKLIALEGIALLKSLALPKGALVLAIVLLTALLNLFIGSASAKWAMISTVFVPVFMGVGISPELTQAAYRVGDSVTNSITPLNPYLVIILVFMRQYLPKAGIGTLISLMLPYTIAFGVVWTLLLGVWMLLGVPLGPGGALFLEAI
jgi:aminobenzoyl-glutamate transport protein